MDRLEMVSSLLKPEYEYKTTKRFNNRLWTAHMIGTPCDISQCRDSSQRRYEPTDAPKVLSTLQFIEDGLNVCILPGYSPRFPVYANFACELAY